MWGRTGCVCAKDMLGLNTNKVLWYALTVTVAAKASVPTALPHQDRGIDSQSCPPDVIWPVEVTINCLGNEDWSTSKTVGNRDKRVMMCSEHRHRQRGLDICVEPRHQLFHLTQTPTITSLIGWRWATLSGILALQPTPSCSLGIQTSKDGNLCNLHAVSRFVHVLSKCTRS
jgi:hypothetical protein